MSNLYSFVLLTLVSLSSPLPSASTSTPEALDLLIRDYTFKSYDNITTKTGYIHNVNLPLNLSGITAHAVRFRCGSLSRYGAQIDGFTLGRDNNNSLIVSPCVERVMLITTNLGLNWSSTSYNNHLLSGYKLVSPILGLTAYDAGSKTSYPFEIGIRSSRGNPIITVNFTNVLTDDYNLNTTSSPLCAIFARDGKFSLKPPTSPRLCSSTTTGHFGLVVKDLVPLPPNPSPAGEGDDEGGGGRAAAWKVALESSIGGVMGIVLLGLLMVAMFGKAKKKAKMVELQRKAYEEEALQVSMVGHVIRAPLASSCTRTVPTIDNDHHFVPNYINPSSRAKK